MSGSRTDAKKQGVKESEGPGHTGMQAPPPKTQTEAYVRMAKRRMGDQVGYLRKHGNGLKNMEYFYQGFENLHSGMVEQIKRQKAQGKKVVGVYCNFVPIELILAAGAVPLRMCSGFNDTILSAEEVLPRNFCPLIKSSYGAVIDKDPLFKLADVVIVPTSCDGKKKMCELLAEKVQVWIMEVPHTTNTPEARKLWLNEIKSLKIQLQKLTGRRITRGRIKKAVSILNEQRAQVHKLYNLRKKAPSIWGRDALLVTNFASYDDPERWTKQVKALNKELEKTPPIPANGFRPRILITGTPIVMPTWKIPVLIEESGGMIVADDICTGTKGMWDPVETSAWTGSDMMVSLADRYLMNTCATFTPNTSRLIRLKKFVTDWNVDGVIYYVIMACHPYGLEQKKINSEMEAMNIPVLNIETDFSEEDVEQLRTRIEAFIEMISTRHAIKTGTVLDKKLHPKGHATKGPATPLTREQVAHKLKEAPLASREMDFPFEELSDGAAKSGTDSGVEGGSSGSAGRAESGSSGSAGGAKGGSSGSAGGVKGGSSGSAGGAKGGTSGSASGAKGGTAGGAGAGAGTPPSKEELEAARLTGTLLEEVKKLVTAADKDSKEGKAARKEFKKAIDQYKSKDFKGASATAEGIKVSLRAKE